MKLLLALIVVVVACASYCESKSFGKICSSNPSNSIRSDVCGSGYYGASRSGGRRSHKGIDIKCSSGSKVYAPFPAKVTRSLRVYANNNGPHNTGLELKGTGKWQGYKVKMFYVKMTASRGSSVSSGDAVGTMTNMAREYNCRGMINHVHVQLYRNGRVINPTSYA